MNGEMRDIPGMGETYEVTAKGNASLESQNAYLQSCLRAKENEIATLQTKLKTSEQNRKLDKEDFERRVDAVQTAYSEFRDRYHQTFRATLAPRPAPKKQGFWARLFRPLTEEEKRILHEAGGG